DAGIILFRRMLKQQLELALDGGEPMNVFRDPAANEAIVLPMETVKFGDRTYLDYSPAEAGDSAALDDINRVLATWAAVRNPVAGAGMTDAEAELRAKVALACRILAVAGLVKEITGHVSARISGADEMLIRCRGEDEYGLRWTSE